jgi:hypothetical protein
MVGVKIKNPHGSDSALMLGFDYFRDNIFRCFGDKGHFSSAM